MYLQCKLALQVQSKHIKILKKKNQKKAQTNWHTWREKKRKKKKEKKKCTSLKEEEEKTHTDKQIIGNKL